MNAILLNGSDWQLTGYWQHFWKMGRADNAGWGPATPPLPCTVPGAVHADLLAAGLIPDWQNGLDAFKSEWVNNREWSIRKEVTVPEGFGQRIILECDGLDYSGHVLIDGQTIADFEGTHFVHRFDLTGKVTPGQPCQLEFIFHVAPQIEGQIGYTSRTRLFKPRFGYCWDWITRIVNVGIWQDVRLVGRGQAELTHLRVLPRVHDDLQNGTVRVYGELRGSPDRVRYLLTDAADRTVASGERPATAGPLDLEIDAGAVQLWWPADMGHQPLYQLTIEVLDHCGVISDRMERSVGFKRVRWLHNPDRPDDAEPFLCEINGQTVMLRGVNWVVPSPLYGAVTRERYDAYLRLYRNMHVNLLRVWGGAILEAPTFYNLCDRLGLLVWQELPLSSSGIDNWPPEDEPTIHELERIATEYVERRAHHVCHLLWCGGNELQGGLDGGKTGVGKPVGRDHPLMARWERLFADLDPGKRFLPTSPTGPRFTVELDAVGKGLHHMVHGPWANLPLAQRYEFFNRDDSLFRSESGAPGCASLASLERHKGDQSLWPPTHRNIHWLTPCKLWIPWDDVTREFGPLPDDPPAASHPTKPLAVSRPPQLSMIVKASRYLQAESYRYAAESARRRFPTFSGYAIWMGHDVVHCTANNSIIQIDATTKPAYDWLQRAFAPRHVSLRHDRICYAADDRFTGQVWVHRDDPADTSPGRITVRLRTLDGITHEERSLTAESAAPSFMAAEVTLAVPVCPHELFVIELLWQDETGSLTNRYLLSQRREHPLAPLWRLPPVTLEAIQASPACIDVRNPAAVAAIGVRLIQDAFNMALLTDQGHLTLFPGESQEIRYATLPAEPGIPTSPEHIPPQVECFNHAAR